MAASVLIIMAFGAGYFYAVYNLDTPQLADDSKSTTLDQQNIEAKDLQSFQNTNPGLTKTSSTEKQKTEIDQNENFEIPRLKSELVASNDNTAIGNIQINEGSNLSSINPDPVNSMELVNIMQTIDISNIPIDQHFSALQDDQQITVVKNKIAVTQQAPMSLYYYPEDYDLAPNKKELDRKWAVGAQFAPVVSYREISINYANQQGSLINDEEAQLNNAEESLLSYAGGVDVNYHVSKRWSIQSGLYFSRIGQVNNDALNFKQDDDQYLLFSINTSTGNINVAFEKVPDDVRKVNPPKDTLSSLDIGSVSITQNFDLFEVPVMIKYALLNKRFGIDLSGGLSPAYLIKNNTYLEVDNQKHDIGNSENLNPMIFNTSFALGLNYGITKKLTINFEPTFKYSLSPINKNSGFDVHPYSFSWYTGIRYNF